MEEKKIYKKESINNAPQGEKIIDLLIEIPLIKELSFNIIKQISHEFIKKYYKKNEYVIKQGEPINDIYLILKGSFVITLNHYIEYEVEPDIDTFIKYQNITGEPFNTNRNHEIKGKINKIEEIELFIYQKKYFFGDIEITSNKNNSLFNIRANEDNSILCIMDKKKWCGVIRKIRDKFNKFVSNKMDILYERIKGILLKKKNIQFDKLKLNQDKIYYQLLVNNNFQICNQRLNNFIKYNNKINQKYHKKHKKRLSNINNKTINEDKNKNKNTIHKSQSLINIKTYQEKIMNLFKFPSILKSETKYHFKKFFDKFFIKKDTKKVKLSETKIDSGPLYINRFRSIYSLTPQQKYKFLNIVRNYLNNNYSKEYQTSKSNKNKSKIQELFSMYNYYVNNSHEITYNSTNNNRRKTSTILNNSLKNNFRKNNSLMYNIRINNSYTPNQINNSLNKENRKNLNFGNLKNNNNFDKNKIRMKKIKFINRIMNYSTKRNFDNIIKHSNVNKINKLRNSSLVKFDEIPINRDIKRLTMHNYSNNKIFKNEKITTKSIFDALLRNKCETVKSQMLENIGGDKINKNLGLKININNNIDIRDENYIKNIFFANKFSRVNSFNDYKFK